MDQRKKGKGQKQSVPGGSELSSSDSATLTQGPICKMVLSVAPAS